MEPSNDQLLDLGFAPVLLYSSPTIGPSRGLARMLLSADGRATCLVVAGETSGFSQVVVSLVSLLATGTLLGTSTAVVRLPEVPGVDIVRMPRATAATAAAAHMKRLDGSDVRARTHQQALGLITDQQTRALRYYVRERIYVEATEADVSEARAGSRAQ